MDGLVVIFVAVAFLIASLFLYPMIQARREEALAKRLEKMHDPKLAMLELDKVQLISRHEAGFFGAIRDFFESLQYWD